MMEEWCPHHRASVRTGDEPSRARSPLRLRAVLAAFGLVCAGAGSFAFADTGRPLLAVLFAAVLVLAAGDLAVITLRIRQGPHFQPGRDIPPYRPVDRGPEPPRDRPGTAPDRPGPPGDRTGTPTGRAEGPSPTGAEPALDQHRRMRRYAGLMSTCLALLVLAALLAPASTTGAMVAVLGAMVLPPLAVLAAGVSASGRGHRDEGEREPGD